MENLSVCRTCGLVIHRLGYGWWHFTVMDHLAAPAEYVTYTTATTKEA